MRTIRLDSLEPFQAVNLLSDPGAIPGPTVVPNCAQISIIWSLQDFKAAHVVLYGRYAGTFAGTVAQCEAIKTALTSGTPWTTLNAFFNTGSGLAAVSIRDVNTANNPIVQSTSALVPGTTAGTPLPDEVAVVVTLRTAHAGPQARGRMYIPNWSTTALGAGNVVAAAAVTALGNWASANVPAALNGSGYTHVLGLKARAQYTGSTGRVHPARPATSDPVTSYVVRDNHWDTQRRRGLK